MSRDYYLICDNCGRSHSAFDSHTNSHNGLFGIVRFLKAHTLDCYTKSFKVMELNEFVDYEMDRYGWGNPMCPASRYQEDKRLEKELLKEYLNDTEEVIIHDNDKCGERALKDYCKKDDWVYKEKENV